MGKFTPADAGQMHMYLNYFKENEAAEGDKPHSSNMPLPGCRIMCSFPGI
jgi:hypothetical protein